LPALYDDTILPIDAIKEAIHRIITVKKDFAYRKVLVNGGGFPRFGRSDFGQAVSMAIVLAPAAPASTSLGLRPPRPRLVVPVRLGHELVNTPWAIRQRPL